MKRITILSALAALMLPGGAAAQRTAAEVPYVPTPPAVVSAMLTTAAVRPDDVVYDLGSGDGRIVIAAAAEFGARGVGVEIDGDLVEIARENARRAGVADRVTILERDLFLTDLSEASVVTLYLLPIINYRLQPKFLAELKPGTRIVSHAYDMSEWPPDRELEVEGRWIFFWIVPAAVAGEWEWQLDGSRWEATLQQWFQRVSGQVRGASGAAPLAEATLTGVEIGFETRNSEYGATVLRRYRGIVDGNVMRGSVEIDDAAGSRSAAWRATRRAR
jgi:hypothetical protein